MTRKRYFRIIETTRDAIENDVEAGLVVQYAVTGGTTDKHLNYFSGRGYRQGSLTTDGQRAALMEVQKA